MCRPWHDDGQAIALRLSYRVLFRMMEVSAMAASVPNVPFHFRMTR